MRNQVFMMAAAAIAGALALLTLTSLCYDWSFTDTTFGGYLGVLLPCLLGIALFGCGVLFGHAEARSLDKDELSEILYDAYQEGRMDERVQRIAMVNAMVREVA